MKSLNVAVEASYGGLVNVQMVSQEVMAGAKDSTFLISS